MSYEGRAGAKDLWLKCVMKSKDPGVTGAAVEARVGGNKGREMTGQIT